MDDFEDAWTETMAASGWEEDHPSDLYCGVCGLDYPCGGPCNETAMYSPPADYLDRRPS